MKDQFDGFDGPLRRRDDPPNEHSGDTPIYEVAGGFSSQHHTNGHNNVGGGPPVDPWTIVDLLVRRWYWLILGATVAGVAFFFLGTRLIQPKFTAKAQLLRYLAPGDDDFFRSRDLTAETFTGLIKSPDLLQQVSRGMVDLEIPVIPPEKLVKSIEIEPEPDSDLVKVSLAAANPRYAVDLLNLYLNEAVQFTRELQAKEAGKLANEYLKVQVKQMEDDIAVLTEKFRKMPTTPQVTNLLSEIGMSLGNMSTNLAAGVRPNVLLGRQTQRLNAALGELNDLLVKYTEIHPAVLAKQDEIRSLSNRIAQATAAGVTPAPIPSTVQANGRPADVFNPEMDIVRMKLLSLEDGRVGLLNRQREAALYASDPPGYARVFAPASLKTVEGNMRWVKVGIVTMLGSMLGMACSLFLVGLAELVDRRLRTADDIRRVTRLPVLTGLGELHAMEPAERGNWAFRTWTMLQGRLSRSSTHGLICGITSSSPGEGRSTWISLLAEAASLSGFRVLTIATKPSPSHVSTTNESIEDMNGEISGMKTNGSHALTTSVLSSPMDVTEQLTGPNSQPVVHIPLPGWVWNLERRKQWREALTHWGQIENLVILVELPPADVAEAVLLGSNLPNMVWLAQSGAADAAKTRQQLETLRNARCNVVGAVLNRQPGGSLKQKFPRWLGCFALAAFLLSAGAADAAASRKPRFSDVVLNPATNSAGPNRTGLSIAAAAPRTNASVADTVTAPLGAAQPGYAEDELQTAAARRGFFSVVDPSQKAAWQKRLTLGPGDVLNFGLYGAPELARAEVAIAPDGRISYLEAQDVMAANRTIDELRERMDEELGKYRRAPRTIITPVAFKSKKYYIMGKVMSKGVYSLDRPMTVLEAIARAKGLESGLVDRNVIDLADFHRAFLVREKQRIPVNFEDLFYRGDLSQNVAIEPGDYIYIPGKDVQEVYVVGEVRAPGPVVLTPNLTIIGAIAARGGYTDRAFKTRVIVVRGSINNPEPIAVDTHGILDGRKQNFQLKPRDIIYVNSRPFILVEEAADLAATAFIQSLITSWVGVDVVKPVE